MLVRSVVKTTSLISWEEVIANLKVGDRLEIKSHAPVQGILHREDPDQSVPSRDRIDLQ